MFDSHSQPRKKGLAMEIIACLREEREALVARVIQIDKMLRQYDEWGREAQRLLSLTTSAKVEPVGNRAASASPDFVADADAPDQPKFRQDGDIGVRLRSPSSMPVKGRKTPIPEFEAAVIGVLRETGEPMDRVALYEALTARGIVIGDGGRDKDLNALSARVYRMAQDPKNRISGERGQGYRLMADDEPAGTDANGESSVDERDDDDLI